jgi:hypothetical protein
MTKKKRAKNEPTKGDLLAQSYRNRAAMRRVYDSSIKHTPEGLLSKNYWTPTNMDKYSFFRLTELVVPFEVLENTRR